MLGFSRRETANKQLHELKFEPLVISSQPPSQGAFPKTQQKKITKTTSVAKGKDRKGSHHQTQTKHFQPQASSGEDKEIWVDYGKIQIFDRNLRKNALAQEERRLRAESRKERKEAIREITRNENNIKGKTLQLEREKEAQIEQLKKLIQKEQEEKIKNEQAYQQRLKQIEQQRKDLIKLERKIQEHGVKNQKQYAQEMIVLNKNQYPTNDRSKCHQEIRRPQQPGFQFQHSLEEASHQRQALRQKQLELLTQQREKCIASNGNLNYNPTIIPLLSRASYKIVSTHVSTLVELLVDDMLEEQVYMLEEIELKEKAREAKQRQKDMIHDYYSALENFVDEAETIENKVGQYATMKFEDLYLPKNYPKQEQREVTREEFLGVCELSGMDPDATQQLMDRRDRFIRFVSNFDEYKKGHLTMFEKVTQQLIDEAVSKMAIELDRGSNDFVELMFRKEFE